MKVKASLVKSNDHYEGVSACLDNIKEEIKKAISNMSSLVIKVNFVEVCSDIKVIVLKIGEIYQVA